MIVNVPTAESLHIAARRAFFDTWSLILNVATVFDEVYPPGDDWTKEKTEYLEACQSELQSALISMQLSNELALKARIAEVSPYLLLFSNDRKLSRKPGDIDFGDLRTIEANDLPNAVNCFCTATLSDAFIQDYDEVRSLRNKIVHLGSVDRHFNPDDLLARMVRQFAELWPDRLWLVERLKCATQGRYAFFHDGKYASAEGEVYAELEETFARIGKGQFKQLIGFEKSARRYVCPLCISNSEVRKAGLDPSTCRTAFLLSDRTTVRCSMCANNFKIARTKCTHSKCKGDVTYHANDDAPMCLTCGDYLE
jgi:hypothetical protein